MAVSAVDGVAVRAPEAGTQDDRARVVILGVAASDSHAVANQLIAHLLREHGLVVVNLGTCTPVSEFADACTRHPEAEALIIGSLNGHVHEDLCDLQEAKNLGLIRCPVIVGGNLSVGTSKDHSARTRLHHLGVDHILTSPAELLPLLDGLSRNKAAEGPRTLPIAS